MAVRFLSAGAATLALFAVAVGPPARAGNVNYPFNAGDGGWTVTSDSLTPPEKPWTWIPGPSSNQGGWQAWRGADAPQSGSYLVSPLLVVDDVDGSYVRLDITHRFDFGGTGTTPLLALGQVQYQVNNGNWLGIRTSDFQSNAGNIPPAYANPPYPFIDQTLAPPTGTYAVNAWDGTTDKFPAGDHQPSALTLNFPPYELGPGDLIRFRFLVSTTTPLSGTSVIDWEINKVQIDGVNPVPEPAALALAGIGGLGCILVVRRRRTAFLRATLGSTAVTIVIVVVALALLLAAAPARAGPVIPSWNFQLTDGDWVQSGTNGSGPFLSGSNRWMWTGTTTPTPLTGGTSPHWHVLAQPVQSGYSTGYFLTSPIFSGISGTAPAQNARISIAHDFLFLTGTSGRPITLGQVEYQLNGSGTWVGFPAGAFTSGSSVLSPDGVFGNSPFRTLSGSLQFVNQEAYVAPTFLTPTGTAALPVVAPGALAFSGSTPLWPGDYYVPSQAFLNVNTGLPATGITSLQLRFANANLASDCGDSGWNVRFVQVDFSDIVNPVPEPAALALGATGLVALAVTAARRRIRHQRPSRPSESP